MAIKSEGAMKLAHQELLYESPLDKRTCIITSNQFEVEEDLYFCHLATNRFISGENPQAENNSNGTDGEKMG